MKTLLFLILITFFGAISVSSAQEVARGDWESGSGDGVACWATPEIAKEAIAQIQEEKRLLSMGLKIRPVQKDKILEAKKSIQSLVTLDYFQFKEKLNLGVFASANFSREAVIKGVSDFLKETVPIFADRFELASDQIQIESWVNEKYLPELDDRGHTPEIPAECSILRLAERREIKQIGMLPAQVYVKIDSWYYENKLDGLQKALLEIHERIYSIGKSLMPKSVARMDSFRVRYVVAHLLALSGGRERTNEPIFSAMTVSDLLFRAFGEYQRIFADDPIVKVEISDFKKPNQYTRYHAFAEMLNESRARTSKCTNSQADCRYQEMQSIFNGVGLTPQQSYTVVVWFYFFQSRKVVHGPQALYWHYQNPSLVTEEQRERFARICSLVDGEDGPHQFRGALDKAKSYCKENL